MSALSTTPNYSITAHVRRLSSAGTTLYIRIDNRDVSRLGLRHGQAIEIDLGRVSVAGIVKTSGGSPWLAPSSARSNSEITAALRGANFEHGMDVPATVRSLSVSAFQPGLADRLAVEIEKRPSVGLQSGPRFLSSGADITHRMTRDDSTVADFPPAKDQILSAEGCVYMLCCVTNGTEVPFYVGQTRRFWGRMNDYALANFTACTDFCVGEAIRYLRDKKGYRVVVRRKLSLDPPKEERAIIRHLLVSGGWLLNSLPRYDYRTGSEAEEREIIHRFCEMFSARLSGGDRR